MADITMCNGNKCDKKDTCYRHTAPLNHHQQEYFMASPLENTVSDNVVCGFFMDNSNTVYHNEYSYGEK